MPEVYEQILKDLSLPRESLSELTFCFKRANPKHGMRGFLMHAIHDVYMASEEIPAETKEQFARYHKALGPFQAFEFIPLGRSVTQMVAAGRLFHPDLDPVRATNTVISETMYAIRDTMAFKSLLEASEGSYHDFVQATIDSSTQFLNYGQRAMDEKGPNSMGVFYKDDYPEQGKYYSPGWFEGTMRMFDFDGEVTCEVVPTSLYIVRARW